MNAMNTPQQAEEWKINKRGRACSACARPFKSEEEHYSGIVEVEGRFERRDVCLPCWAQKPELFSFWKTRMPRREEKRLEDVNAMQEFFKKLVEKPSDDPSRQKITYLTALLLSRKRRLRLAGTKDGKLRIEKGWDGEAIEIVDPPISDAELVTLKQQMEQLFEVEFPGDPA
ncbi:MAG TPA: hypothetical protein VJB14_04190 [Planctomycetota bacterium]|nr:hypothetical protein [Planctomycetota bacterium]